MVKEIISTIISLVQTQGKLHKCKPSQLYICNKTKKFHVTYIKKLKNLK